MKYYYSYVHENNYFKYNEQIKGINMNKQRYLKKSISVLVVYNSGAYSVICVLGISDLQISVD